MLNLKTLAALVLLGCVSISFSTAQAGFRVPQCGGLDQRACYILEAFPACDGLPFLRHELAWFHPGYCRAWDPLCGGVGERPCTIFEHVPSCDLGLIEEPLFAPTCSLIDADGFPEVCGDHREPACSITSQLWLGIRSCKPGNIEQLLTDGLFGTCYEILDDGYPSDCGHVGQDACTVNIQLLLGIKACEPGAYEEPPPLGELVGSCHKRDRWGYPEYCGDVDQPHCNPLLALQGILPCKPGLVAMPFGRCFEPPIDNDLYPEACGGDSEAPCPKFIQWVRRVDPCKPGLNHVEGGPGGADGTCVLESVNEPGLQTTAVIGPSNIDEPIRGYADVHNHMFANESFGGTTVVGKTFHPYGVEAALEDCYRPHGLLGVEDLMGNLQEELPEFGEEPIEGRGWHRSGGWPDFEWWPRWNAFTHMQHYHRWLERAYLGGQRLMVMFAMNNEYACLRVSNASPFQTTIPGYECDDMPAVDRQLNAARELVAYIDNRSGGPGQGWLQIAESSAEARQIIADGKMAMVLGFEIDTPFNCREGECTEEYVDQQVDYYYAKGVRSFFPIHAANNAFGGAAAFQDAYNTVNFFLNQDFLTVTDCAPLGLDGIEYDANMEFEFWFGAYLEGAPVAIYPEPTSGHCNVKGLTQLGEHLVNKMMDKGIIIDTEHMSFLMKERVLEIAAERGVPLAATHVLPLETHHNQTATEFTNTREHILEMLNGGGIIAPMVAQWHEDTKWETDVIKDDCNGSSMEFAQSYLYLLGLLEKSDSPYGAIPLATDTHGFIYQPAPRYGPDGCRWNADQADKQPLHQLLEYPFTGPYGGLFYRQESGNRTFDYNVDGLAHVGLLPDFIQDLRIIGVTDEQLKPLFRSAEAYIRMWERVEQAAIGNLPPVADAGPDLTLFAASGATVDVMLDGSGSFDPKEDSLIYTWLMGGDQIATGVNPVIGLTEGTYGIQLIVSDGVLESGADEVTITIGGPPGIPQNLVGRAKNYHVNIAWTGAEGAQFCRVYRRLDSESDFSLSGESVWLAYVDDIPAGTTSAEYYVVAVNDAGESAASDVVTVRPTTRRR